MPPVGPEQFQEVPARVTVSDSHPAQQTAAGLWLTYFIITQAVRARDYAPPRFVFLKAHSKLAASTGSLTGL